MEVEVEVEVEVRAGVGDVPHRPDNGEPLPCRLETQSRAHFTTFGHAPLPIQVLQVHTTCTLGYTRAVRGNITW